MVSDEREHPHRINHRHGIAEALARDPRGKVAVELAEVADAAENPAIPSLLQRILQKALEDADTRERQEVVDELQRHLRESGLSRADFAARLGTSQSRLSTDLSGKIVPSATILRCAHPIVEVVIRSGQPGRGTTN